MVKLWLVVVEIMDQVTVWKVLKHKVILLYESCLKHQLPLCDGKCTEKFQILCCMLIGPRIISTFLQPGFKPWA